MKFKVLLFGLLLSSGSFAADKTLIRIGVLAGGTVQWELPTLLADLNSKSVDFQLDI